MLTYHKLSAIQKLRRDFPFVTGITAELHTKELNARTCFYLLFRVCSSPERQSGIAPLKTGLVKPSAELESTFQGKVGSVREILHKPLKDPTTFRVKLGRPHSESPGLSTRNRVLITALQVNIVSPLVRSGKIYRSLYKPIKCFPPARC
jgi:hypothetical protein